MTTLTSYNHKTTLTVGTLRVEGDWKTISGGALTAENIKNRPGGMAREETIPGVPTREDLTITREFQTGRDAALVGPGGTIERALLNGTTVQVTTQDLDHQRNQVGDAKTFSGVVQSVSRGDMDSEANEVAMLTVVISPVVGDAA